MQNTTSPLRVVIIGAGFGGLQAARALRHATVEIILIDRQNHHLFQPLLYQVATAGLSPGDIAWPVRALVRGQPNVTPVMAEVTGIDTAAHRVTTAEGAVFDYDVLLLAAGTTDWYFGHDEWRAVAPGLKTISDATDLRRRILLGYEHAELTDDPEERRRQMTFAVVGGGPTGVEMAGAMAELASHALARDFRRIDTKAAHIVLIEAGPRILAAFPESLSAVAQASLERMGVEVRTNTRVTACDESGVTCGDTLLPARTIIWAAGVRASPLAALLGAPLDRMGRVPVGADLSVAGMPNVFAVGDLAAVAWKDGRTVPGIAPAAKQMGKYVASVIAARATGAAAPPPFAYRHQGDLATIGRHSAVVDVYGFKLKGGLGWWFWSIAHIWFLIGVRSRVIVTFDWLWNYVTFQRGARLITGRAINRGEAEHPPTT